MVLAAIIVRVHHALEKRGTECSMEEVLAPLSGAHLEPSVYLDRLPESSWAGSCDAGWRQNLSGAGPARRPGRGFLVIAGSFVNTM
jgi:hypothetical protein